MHRIGVFSFHYNLKTYIVEGEMYGGLISSYACSQPCSIDRHHLPSNHFRQRMCSGNAQHKIFNGGIRNILKEAEAFPR